MNSDNGTQLSFLSVSKSGPCAVASARMAQNVLSRLLDLSPSVTAQSAVYFKAIFPAALQAAEAINGLPVSKSTLRPLLLNPASAITHKSPTRPGELEQIETVLEFVQRRLSCASEKARLEEQLALLLNAGPELLVTNDGIASPLFAADRAEAERLFAPLASEGAETVEALVEACVLLRANQADIHTGIAKLFWNQEALHSEAALYVEGCADGQARAYFASLLAMPEERRREIFSKLSLEAFYAAFAN